MVLALDALNCEAALIEAAARLASRLDAELDALFVEDDDLYAAAELPVTQEISRGSARTRELSTSGLTATLRSLSREAEARFRAAAARGQFRTTRARRSDALSAACGDVDLLLVPARRAAVRIHVHLQAAPPAHLFALCADTPASARVLETGARLARADHDALELIATGPTDETRLAALAHGGLRIARHQLAADATLEEALAHVDNRPGNTLLVAADLPLAADRAALLEVLSGLRCTSLLVN
jgi:hypothetical protein